MGAQHLLPDGLESVAGHSPRNFLTSVVAALGFSKDVEHGFGLFGGVRPHLPPSGLQDPKGGEQVLGVAQVHRSSKTRRLDGYVTSLRSPVQIQTGSRRGIQSWSLETRRGPPSEAFSRLCNFCQGTGMMAAKTWTMMSSRTEWQQSP